MCRLTEAGRGHVVGQAPGCRREFVANRFVVGLRGFELDEAASARARSGTPSARPLDSFKAAPT